LRVDFSAFAVDFRRPDPPMALGHTDDCGTAPKRRWDIVVIPSSVLEVLGCARGVEHDLVVVPEPFKETECSALAVAVFRHERQKERSASVGDRADPHHR